MLQVDYGIDDDALLRWTVKRSFHYKNNVGVMIISSESSLTIKRIKNVLMYYRNVNRGMRIISFILFIVFIQGDEM